MKKISKYLNYKKRKPKYIKCKICNKYKSIKYFSFRKESGTYRRACKTCRRKKLRLNKRNWYRKNKEHADNVRREYWKNNEAMLAWNRQYQKKYRKKNKKRLNKRARERRQERYYSDILFRLRVILSARFSMAIKNNYKTGSAVRDLGCSIAELKILLESMFYDNTITGEKMTWDNQGAGWEIDHIKPFCYFDLEDRNQVLEVCNYKNLRPLWKEEHKLKSAREKKNINNYVRNRKKKTC